MGNPLGFFLLTLALFCSADLSSARQVPKECSKGPSYWCVNLRKAVECGAMGHCISTVWETQNEPVRPNEISDKVIRLFRQLKDIKDLINSEYLGTRVSSACRDMPNQAIRQLCKNTAHMDEYLRHVLLSDTTPCEYLGTRVSSACRDMPNQAIRQLCKENTAHMDEYLSHVLLSDTTPESMCRVVGMCNSQKLENILNLTKKKTNSEVAPPHPRSPKDELLGASKCTWGPSYWCSNFTSSRECKATQHCVQRVWSKMTFPEDKDDICKICTDMVKEARDQLQSNETQEELKEVFEGSCKLIPIKIVSKECIKLADDFVPELVETLASQMNPQAVCSVAGLCNNARIDKLLERYNQRLKQREDCNGCHRTVGVLRKKFDATSYENFLVGLLKVCGRLGSLSDSCSMVMFSYYENIVAALKKDLTPKSLCHLSGQCQHMFHTHDEFTFPEVNIDDLKATDDVPCEFCEKLVVHLRDVLIANTTELQFEKILKGLCKQTGNFKTECAHLVEQYYPVIYTYLTSELKPAEICSMMGICTNKTKIDNDVPVMPLLLRDLAVSVTPSSKLIGADDNVAANIQPKKENVRILGSDPSPLAPAVPPLPIERMMVRMPQNKAACSFCQYFLHYLQVELSDTKTEEKIKAAVDKACEKLPQSINAECQQFVTEYGPACIALLVQEIDPGSVCPALSLCPAQTIVRRVSVSSQQANCPLCLFAVEQLETMLKNNRSEESIRHALDGLCNHLSAKLRTQCVDFVDQYTNQLVEMLVANMNAQEICVFLKLCKDDAKVTNPLGLNRNAIDKYHDTPQLRRDRNNRRQSILPKRMLEGHDADIMTNEIPDNTVNGREVSPPISQKSICVVCEFVLKEINDEIKDKHNEDEIKRIVHGICKRMPKSVKGECDQFVDKYADLVITLLAQELNPDQVCQELKLCDPSAASLDKVKEEILDCAVCETVVLAVKKVLSSDRVDRNIVHIVEKSCALLPAKFSGRCHTMMEIYGDSVIHLIEEYGSKAVCAKIGLCAPRDSAYLHMRKDNN